MGVGVVFPGVVMPIMSRGFVRGEFFEPILVVLEQSLLVIIYVNRSGNVHRVYQTQPLLDPAFLHEFRDSIGDVHEASPGRDFKPEVFG